MLGGLFALVAVMSQGILAMKITIIKLRLRLSKYLNFNNLVKIFVHAPYSQDDVQIVE